MMFAELKRILTKLPVLVLVLLIIPVFAVSASITGIKQPAPPPLTVSQEQIDETNERFSNLSNLIHAVDNSADTDALFQKFDAFAFSLNGFFTCDVDDIADFRNYFTDVNQNYINFAAFADQIFGGASTVLITSGNYKTLSNWMDDTEKYIEFDPAMIVLLDTTEELVAKRLGIVLAWNKYSDTSNELSKHTIYKILTNAESTVFTDDQKYVLRNIAGSSQLKIETITDEVNKTEFKRVVCEYLELNIKLMQAQNKAGITRFQGFKDFNQSSCRDRIAVVGFLVAEGKTETDFSSPYSYGKVLNKSTGSTALDFIFNNLELITIPLVILACLIVIFCIFDDIKKNTVLNALVSPQSRQKIIIAKLLACTVAIALSITVFVLLFLAAGMILTGGVAAPAVLTAFGGKAVLMSPFMLFIVYLLSLFFKILVFASVTALLCINAVSLKQVLIKSAIIVSFVIILNLMFTVVFPFAIYQYLPLIALDFAGFFGIGFMLSGHLSSVFIWFTLPVMILIWIAVLFFTVRNFNKRDF